MRMPRRVKKTVVKRAELKTCNDLINRKRGERVMVEQPRKRTTLADLRRISIEAIKKRGLTEEEVRKMLGDKKYE